MRSSIIAAMAALSLVSAFQPAQARETKTVILLEAGDAPPIFCDPHGTMTAIQLKNCENASESGSKDLRGQVDVEMRLDPDCAGMAFANGFGEVGSFGSIDEIDYINVSVMFIPPDQRSWWLNIVKINGRNGPDYMGGKASSAKEIAHKLCYIIHQEKITRR
jgi:hypothetical protein